MTSRSDAGDEDHEPGFDGGWGNRSPESVDRDGASRRSDDGERAESQADAGAPPPDDEGPPTDGDESRRPVPELTPGDPSLEHAAFVLLGVVFTLLVIVRAATVVPG